MSNDNRTRRKLGLGESVTDVVWKPLAGDIAQEMHESWHGSTSPAAPTARPQQPQAARRSKLADFTDEQLDQIAADVEREQDSRFSNIVVEDDSNTDDEPVEYPTPAAERAAALVEGAARLQ